MDAPPAAAVASGALPLCPQAAAVASGALRLLGALWALVRVVVPGRAKSYFEDRQGGLWLQAVQKLSQSFTVS